MRKVISVLIILLALCALLGCRYSNLYKHKPNIEAEVMQEMLAVQENKNDKIISSNVISIEVGKSMLKSMKNRIGEYREAGNDLASYFEKQVEIIERLFIWIEEDRSKSEIPFFKQEVVLQEAELSMLISTLQKELELNDKNTTMYTERHDRTVNLQDYNAIGDGIHNDGPALKRAIDAAVSLGPGAKIIIPKGRYAIGTLQESTDGAKAHLVFQNIQDLLVEAEPDTVFVMKNVNTGILIKECQNIIMRNIAIDYDPLPFTQGKIIAVNAEKSTFDWAMSEGYPQPTLHYFQEASELRGTVRFPDTGEIDFSAGDFRIGKIESLGSNQYRFYAMQNDRKVLSGLTKNFKTGYSYVLYARSPKNAGKAVTVEASSYITLEGIQVYSSFEHAFLLNRSHAVKLRKCAIEPLPGSGRLGCTNADGIHCPSNRKGPLVENCRIYGTNDDCINIYGKCYALADSNNPYEFIIDKPGGNFEGFSEGDNVCFINPNTGEFIDFAMITKVETARWKGKVVEKLILDRPIENMVTREMLQKGSMVSREYVFRTDEPVEHFIVNLDTLGTGFVITNCTFGYNRASCMKIKSVNGIIQGNSADYCVGVPMNLLAGLNWLEAYPPRNILISNNTFQSNKAAISTNYVLPKKGVTPAFSPIRRIMIQNNEIRENGDFAIQLSNAQDILIEGNTIYSNSFTPKLNQSQDIRIQNNILKNNKGEIISSQ